MPYIKNNRRNEVDEVLRAMEKIDIKADGDLNYLLYKYCSRNINPSYNNYKNYCAELRQCATEIERRMLADYENQKIIENGDV